MHTCLFICYRRPLLLQTSDTAGSPARRCRIIHSCCISVPCSSRRRRKRVAAASGSQGVRCCRCRRSARPFLPPRRRHMFLISRAAQVATCCPCFSRGSLCMPRTPAPSLHSQQQQPAGAAALLSLKLPESRCPLSAFFRVRDLTFAQCKGDGASAAAWAALSSRLPPAST